MRALPIARKTGQCFAYCCVARTPIREESEAEGRMEEEYGEGRHVQGRTQDDTICRWSHDFMSRQGHWLEDNMAGAAIIGHTFLGRGRKIQDSDETCGRSNLPLTKTGETGQLDSEKENEPDD